MLAQRLVPAVGKEPLTGIVLDASYYPADLRVPGIEDSNEAYNALNSALAVPGGAVGQSARSPAATSSPCSSSSLMTAARLQPTTFSHTHGNCSLGRSLATFTAW